MRTTLTLDDDVAAQLRRIQASSGKRFRDVVNDALRMGLARLEEPRQARRRYRQPASSLGGCLLPNLDDVAEVLAIVEGEAYR